MKKLKQKWYGMWRSNPPSLILLLLGLFVAFVMAIPVLYVAVRSLTAGGERWMRLLDDRIPQLLWNTVSLAAAVTFMAILLGVSLAWILTRTDIPGKKIWQWLLVIPLVIPPYVGAVTYIIVFGRSGWLRDLWIGDYPFDIYTFGGTFFVLSMFTFPYVYLLVRAALKKMNRSYEEAAYSLGMSAWETFWKVNLPLMRPAIGAGAILVALYVMSDFGAVSMLRYVTFTAAIYFQRAGFDTASEAVLSLVLIVMTVILLRFESWSRRKNKYYQTGSAYKKPDTIPLGKLKPLALFYVALIFFISVVLPISVLIYWSRIGLMTGALDMRFIGFALNSLKVSGLAALLCMAFSIPIIYLKSRYPAYLTSFIDRLAYAGYALPGVIVALGFVFIFNNHIPALYGTFYVVAIAFVVRFLPQAMQSGESSLNQISPKIDEAARSLGYSSWGVIFKVILPNMLPGVFAGGALVFVNSIKELPVTLMLRPPGFDTLAIRVYFEASEAVYHLAAPAALLIILVSIIPLKYMVSKY